MADNVTSNENSLLTFDDSDIVVVPMKADAADSSTVAKATGEKLAGSQNAQNYQKN